MQRPTRDLRRGAAALLWPLFALMAGCGTGGDVSPAAVSMPAPPALNHIYVVLDQATFAAVRDSRWVRESLARGDAGLPDFAAPTVESDRLFLRGRHTYLELFAPDNRFNEPVGKVGVAMGLDERAELDALERLWRRAYADDVRRTDVVFRRIDPAVPWYDAVQRDATSDNPHLVAWAMTYRPEFVQWQSSGKADVSSARRADVLAARWNPGQSLLDVVGITVSVPRALHDELVEQFSLAGFQHEDTPQGTGLTGRDWRIRLRADDGSPGLESIELRVRPGERVPCLRLGTTWLAAGNGDILRWDFGADRPGRDDACARSGSPHPGDAAGRDSGAEPPEEAMRISAATGHAGVPDL